MKFTKLILYNFKPYYMREEITLFQQERRDYPITLNIGPTGRGKTSISEAIMWCLFGESYSPASKWEKWVNEASIDVAKEKNESEVEMYVELKIDLEGESYSIIRTGFYNIQEERRKKRPKLDVLKGGKPIEEEPTEFVNKHFVTVDLMKYFVFDAEDLLDLFEKNQEKAIKDNINRILHVEILDEMNTLLDKTIAAYDHEIQQIHERIPGTTSTELSNERKDKRKKEEAIEQLKQDIDDIRKRQSEIFPDSPSGTEEEFCDLVDRREKLKRELDEINQKFLTYNINGYSLPANIHLLFLSDILNSTLKKVEEKKPSQSEFEISVKIIEAILEENFSGIVFSEEDKKYLIEDFKDVNEGGLRDIGAINFPDTEKETLSLSVYEPIKGYETRLHKTKEKFLQLLKKMEEKRKELVNVRLRIEQIGDTEKNREMKEDFDKFMELDKRIDEKERRISTIKIKRKDTIERINKLKKNLDLKREHKDEIKEFENRKKHVKRMVQLIDKTKSEFMSELLNEVNSKASSFLRDTVKEKRRFNSMEVTSDYQMIISRANAEKIGEHRINKGNLQIALMSFFFALSEHLGKKIPYVIDAPLMRLDIGHDKRLITNLGRTKKQIVMHVIPGKEYTTESFKWLSGYVNTQNWINREELTAFPRLRSFVEKKNPSKFVEFDIDNL